jgi:DNA replication protein DnaC
LFDDEFLKRLQIVITWLADIAQTTEEIFDDKSNALTIMADYRLPQVLINDGVITISDEVRAKLTFQLIDTDVERTLRAVTIVACEEIAKLLGISTTAVDRALWQRSQYLIKSGRMTAPSIRVATRSY